MSGSKSEQQSAITTSDSRRVLGERSISSENSTVLQTNLSYSLDADVVDSALGAVAKNNTAAFDFGGDALGGAYGFGTKAMQIAANGSAEAMGLAGSALTSSGAAMQKSYDFSSDALAGAYGYGQKSNASAMNFAGDALAGARDAIAGVLSSNGKAQAGAFDFVGGALSSLLGFTNAAEKRAVDSSLDASNTLKNAYADAKGRGAMTDYIIIGVVLVAGVIAWKAIK